MTSDYLLRTAVRTLTVLAVVFISYGGIGVVADIKAGRVHAAESVFTDVAFNYPFSSTGVLYEADNSAESSSPFFWLASGAKLILDEGRGSTIQDELAQDDRYAERYARFSGGVSDDGAHPQNDFRLLTKKTWDDARQEVAVTIHEHNLSNADNRHPWNGIDLISRYQNDGSFYFASVRMDGKVTLKKHSGGAYYLLGQKALFPGTYAADANPTLLPEGETMRLALETFDDHDGSVTLKLYVDQTGTGDWQLVLQETDTGEGGAPLRNEGRVGVYSDFMDVSFDDLRILTRENADLVESADEEASLSTADLSGSVYGLARSLTLQESGSPSGSGNSDWWLNSGGYFHVENGIGKTNEGELPKNDRWRELYARSNPRDTDNGYHPQNIFRLLTQDTWKNVRQEAYFNIRTYHESESPLRTGHNGVLFFNRYEDGDNLYYTGLRVDGKAIIKKKVGGTYYTLDSGTVFEGSFDRDAQSNLIPEREWVGLRSEVTDNADGSVRIRVYADTLGDGSWKLVAEATDDGRSYGRVIDGSARAGIRTDYMDVWFKDYTVSEL